MGVGGWSKERDDAEAGDGEGPGAPDAPAILAEIFDCKGYKNGKGHHGEADGKDVYGGGKWAVLDGGFKVEGQVEEDAIKQDAVQERVEQDGGSGASRKHAVGNYGVWRARFVEAEEYKNSDSCEERAERLLGCPPVDGANPGDGEDEASGAKEEEEDSEPVDASPFEFEGLFCGFEFHEQRGEDWSDAEKW